MEFSSGNPLIDCLLLLGVGSGVGYWLKKDTPERAEALKIRSANDCTVAISGQKHESYQKAAEALGKSFQGNTNIDPMAAQNAMSELAKNFGIIS
jgi:hypothetical protein